jgi:ethanolamine permease
VLYNWNTALRDGFWEVYATLLLIAVGYWCLTVCLAEMASALPFNGGMYGFIRLTCGSFAGFVVGTTEAFQNILFVTVSVLPLGEMLTDLTGWPRSFEPLYWLLFYALTLSLCISGDRFLWIFIRVFGALFLVLMAVYLLGSVGVADFHKYVVRGSDSRSRLTVFRGLYMLKELPSAAWYFIGIESLPLVGVVAIDVSASALELLLIVFLPNSLKNSQTNSLFNYLSDQLSS